MRDTPEEARFRAEVRDWVRANLPDDIRDAARRATSVFVEAPISLAWQKILHAKGWVAPSWPAEYGGTGWDERGQHIFMQECVRAGAPSLAPMGLKMVGPCIMRYGTPEQKAFYLPRILSGEDYWCQGYSEPGSGSDLASLSLRAVREGDDYVLNGSKIWTTHAHYANRMFALVRTSREGKPQAGISFLLLDMDTAGITVDPIITLAGDHELNQVFFEDVRVPVSNRLGEENAGWTVAKYLLEFERANAVGPSLRGMVEEIAGMMRDAPDGEGGVLADHADWRAELGRAAALVDAVEAAEDSVLAAIARGENPGVASSMLKVRGTEAQQALQRLAVRVAGPYACVHAPQVQQAGVDAPVSSIEVLLASARYMNGRAASIYGGSNEIQRGIISRQVLGL